MRYWFYAMIILCVPIFISAQDDIEQERAVKFSVKKVQIDFKAEQIAFGANFYGILHENGLVSLIDAKTEQLVGTITADNNPQGITFARNKFAVLNFDGSVDIINVTTKAVAHLVPITKGYDGGSIATNGTYFCTLGINGAIKVFSAVNHVALANKLGNRRFSSAIFSGSFIYATEPNSDQVIKLSLRGGELAVIDVENTPQNIIVAGTKLYVANQRDNSISIIQKDKVIDRRIVGSNPDGMAFGLNKVAVACNDGTLRIIKDKGFETRIVTGPFTRYARVAFGNNKFAVLNHVNGIVTFVDAKKANEVKIGAVKVGNNSKDIVFFNGKFFVLDANGLLYIITDK